MDQSWPWSDAQQDVSASTPRAAMVQSDNSSVIQALDDIMKEIVNIKSTLAEKLSPSNVDPTRACSAQLVGPSQLGGASQFVGPRVYSGEADLPPSSPASGPVDAPPGEPPAEAEPPEVADDAEEGRKFKCRITDLLRGDLAPHTWQYKEFASDNATWLAAA